MTISFLLARTDVDFCCKLAVVVEEEAEVDDVCCEVELLRHELLSLTNACKRSCNVGTRFRLGSLLFSNKSKDV